MNPRQMESLHAALLSAYPSREALGQFLLLRLGWNLDEIAGAGGLANVVVALLRHAEGRGKLEQLLDEAHRYNPGNPKLRDCYWAFFGSEAPAAPEPGGSGAAVQGGATRRPPFKLVYHCAPDDGAFGTALEKQLTGLVKAGLIERPWSEATIRPGAVRNVEIRRHWDDADIILLLVSANLLADGDLYLDMAAARHAQGAVVVPIIVRPALWETSSLGGLQAYPFEGRAVKPISRWSDPADAWLNVITALRELAEARRDGNIGGPGPSAAGA